MSLSTSPSRKNGSGDFSSFRQSSSLIETITTEGWLELFLNAAEKRTFSRWTETINDKSLTHRATKTIFDRVAGILPDNVAPNVITAAGFACLGQAWYVQNLYGELFPTACTWFAVVNILIFFVTNSVDSRHAERLRQQSALGELFKYSCDCCSTVFLTILATYCLGGTSNVTQWYAVQASQLLLFTKHLSAFHRNAGIRYNVLTGPGEVILSGEYFSSNLSIYYVLCHFFSTNDGVQYSIMLMLNYITTNDLQLCRYWLCELL